MLYLFAAVFGFAYGGVSCAGSPLVAEFFGLGSHGLIFGFLGLGFTIGAAVGPFLTGYIFDTTDSYRLAFLVSGALSIVALVLAILLKPIKREKLPVPEVSG
jgi:MFS family permease